MPFTVRPGYVGPAYLAEHHTQKPSPEQWNTTPQRAMPERSRIDAARALVPPVVNSYSGEDPPYSCYDGDRPRFSAPNKFIRANRLVKLLDDKGIFTDAAEWAIHELIEEKCFTVHGNWNDEAPQVLYGAGSRGDPPARPRFMPKDFKDHPVPFDTIVLLTTDTLWDRFKSSNDPKLTEPSENKHPPMNPESNPIHVLIDELHHFKTALWQYQTASTKAEHEKADSAWDAMTTPFIKIHRFPSEVQHVFGDPALAWCKRREIGSDENNQLIWNAATLLARLATSQPVAVPSRYHHSIEAKETFDQQGKLLETAEDLSSNLRHLTALAGEAWSEVASQSKQPAVKENLHPDEPLKTNGTAATVVVIDPDPPKPDGPFGADGFRFRGFELRFGRAALRKSLVMALWDEGKRIPQEARLVEDVISEVYGHDNDTEDSTFRQLCSDTRGLFDKNAIPLTIEMVQGKVQLSPRPL